MKYPFTDEEQKIRKRWKLANKAFYLTGLLICIILVTLLYFLNALDEKYIIKAGVVSIGSVIFYLIMNRCTYTKYGTKFMTFVMIMAPVRIIQEISRAKDIYDFIGIFVSMGLYGWWLYASMSLKPLNKKAKSWVNSNGNIQSCGE